MNLWYKAHVLSITICNRSLGCGMSYFINIECYVYIFDVKSTWSAGLGMWPKSSTKCLDIKCIAEYFEMEIFCDRSEENVTNVTSLTLTKRLCNNYTIYSTLLTNVRFTIFYWQNSKCSYLLQKLLTLHSLSIAPSHFK